MDRFEKRHLMLREVAGIESIALSESIELKYQMRLLFKLLGKQDEAVRGVCDDDAWVMGRFDELLHVPRYALIKRCLRRELHEEGFCFQFHPLISEEKVYSKEYRSRDIRVTNCNDDSLITTLTGHTDIVCRLIIDDGKLYSSSDDNTIKIWNCSTDTLIKTLTGHTDDVYCLTISYGKLYSGSDDHSIKVWNCSTNELITTLGVSEKHEKEGEREKGHTKSVLCLTINDGKLYSGSWDYSIKVWDCSTNKLITTIDQPVYPVYRLITHGGKLYSKTLSGIEVYDCSEYRLITTLEDHGDFPWCVEIHDGMLYTGTDGKTINVYDCSDDSLITTLRGHASEVWNLTFQNGKLYAELINGDIYIWKL